MTLHIAALASGTGSNVAAILKRIDEGKLDARIVAVLSNNPEAPVLEKARARGIATWARTHRDFPDREAFDRQLLSAIRQNGADTVVLAGYMRLVSGFLVREFFGRMLNIHPAILPCFPGVHGGAEALEYGVRLTGATVHFVDEHTDNGPVVIQAAVPARGTDDEESLMPRIHALEHRIYPQALQWLAEGRLKINGRKVLLLPPQGAPREFPLASCGDGPLGPWMVSPALEGF